MNRNKTTGFFIGSLMVLTILVGASRDFIVYGAAEPSIRITLVPGPGEGSASNGAIGGTVGGISPEQQKECAVVVFSHTDKWYVQPTVASPYTPISDDGSWETDIHLGYEYAALLVRSSYRPPATAGALPKVGGDVLALARVPAKKQ
jgi:hypothetical protein